MTTVTISTKSEINKALLDVTQLIQHLAKEGQKNQYASIANLPQLVQSAAHLIDSAKPYLD